MINRISIEKNKAVVDVLQKTCFVLMIFGDAISSLSLLSFGMPTLLKLFAGCGFIGMSILKGNFKKHDIIILALAVTAVILGISGELCTAYNTQITVWWIGAIIMLSALAVHIVNGIRSFRKNEYMQLELAPSMIMTMVLFLTFRLGNTFLFNVLRFCLNYALVCFMLSFVLDRKRDESISLIIMTVLSGLAVITQLIVSYWEQFSTELYAIIHYIIGGAIIFFHITNIRDRKTESINAWQVAGLVVAVASVFHLTGKLCNGGWLNIIWLGCFFASLENLPKKLLIIPAAVLLIGCGDTYIYKQKRVYVKTEDWKTEIADFEYLSYLDMEEITIGNNIKKIGRFAFMCSHISEITIPESVETIEEGAFEKCTMLKKITLEGFTKLNHKLFGYLLDYKPATIYVHGKYIEIYKEEYPEYEFEAID